MPAVLSSLSSEASSVLHDMSLSRNGDGGGGMLQQLVSRFTAAVGALVEMEQAQAATSALGITDAVVEGVTDAASMVAADEALISSSSASVLAASTSPFLRSLARLFARFLSYFTALLKASPWAQSISAMIHRLVDAADYDAFSAVNDTFGNRMLDRMVRLARLMYRATADALRFGNWILNPVLLLRRVYRISVGLIVLYCVHMFVNFAGDRIRRFFDWFYIERGIWRQDPKCIRKRELEEQMAHAKNYSQWRSAAQQMDELEYERMEWKETKQCTEYEWRRIERNVECLRKLIHNHQSLPHQQHSPTPSIAPSPSTVGAVAPLHPGENSPPKKMTSINPASGVATAQTNSPIAAVATSIPTAAPFSSDPQALMRYLRSRLFRHIGNITNSRLYYDVHQHFTSNFPDPPPSTTIASTTAASTRSSSFSSTSPPLPLKTSFAGVLNPCCHVGTKKLIESYHQEVIRGLDTVLLDPSIPSHTKLAFFRETRHAYGRSALLLNGGANLGLMHLGVVKALLEIDCLPQIISGSSVGAIFAALICSRTDDDLRQIGEDGFLELKFPSVDGSLRRKLRRFLTEGILMDISTLIQCVRTHIGDLTFLQAYERFGRILNIAVTPIHMGKKKRKNSDINAADEEDESQHASEPILLNYLTAPSVLIWSAACASCAVPHLYAPVELLAKSSDGSIVPYFQHTEGDETMRFGAGCVDGSVAKMDVHVDRLRTLFNCSNFIVSQLNLSLLPFIFEGTSFSNASPLQKLLRYLAREIYQRVTNFASLFGVNASSLGRQHTIVRVLLYAHSLTSQAFKGDITLVPPVSWRDYSRLLENPSTKRLNHCVDVARRYTWTRASLIKAHCVVEFALDRCVRKIRTEIGISTLPSATNAAFAHPNRLYSSIAYSMNNSSSNNMGSVSPYPNMNQSPAQTPAQPVTNFWSKKLNARALHSSRKHSLTSDMPIPPQQIQGLPPAGELNVGRISPSFHPVSALTAMSMQNGTIPMHRPIATTPGQGSGSVTPVGYPTSSPGAFMHSSNAPRHRSNSSVSNTSGSPVMLPVMIPQLVQQTSHQLPLSPLQLGPTRSITNGHAIVGPPSAQPSPRNQQLSQSVPTPANIVAPAITSLTQSQPHPHNRVLEYLSNAEDRVGEGSMIQLPTRPLPAKINPSAAVAANSQSNFDLNGLRIVPGASPQSPDYSGTVAATVVAVENDEDEVASGPFGEGDADDDRDSIDENHSECSSPIGADSSRDDLTVEMEQDASSSSNLPSAASSRTTSRAQRRRTSLSNGRSLSQLSQRSKTSQSKSMNNHAAIPSPTIAALKEELQLRLSREGSKQSVNGVTAGSNGATDGSLLRTVPSLPGANGSAASLLLQLPASTSGSKLDDGFNHNVMAHLNQQMLFVMPKSNTKKNPRDVPNVKKMNPTPAPSPAVDSNSIEIATVLLPLKTVDGAVEKKEGLTVSLSPASGNTSAVTSSSTETSPIILHCASTSSSEGSSVDFDMKPIDKPLSTC